MNSFKLANSFLQGDSFDGGNRSQHNELNTSQHSFAKSVKEQIQEQRPVSGQYELHNVDEDMGEMDQSVEIRNRPERTKNPKQLI